MGRKRPPLLSQATHRRARLNPHREGSTTKNKHRKAPWNKGKLVGQKAPLKLKELWAIRVRLQLSGHTRNLALFNLAIDSKLRGCDLVCLRIRDVSRGTSISTRAIVLQRKTHRPVQFEVSEQTRTALLSWIHSTRLGF